MPNRCLMKFEDYSERLLNKTLVCAWLHDLCQILCVFDDNLFLGLFFRFVFSLSCK